MSTNQTYYDPASLAESSYVFFDNLDETDWKDEDELKEFLSKSENSNFSERQIDKMLGSPLKSDFWRLVSVAMVFFGRTNDDGVFFHREMATLSACYCIFYCKSRGVVKW